MSHHKATLDSLLSSTNIESELVEKAQQYTLGAPVELEPANWWSTKAEHSALFALALGVLCLIRGTSACILHLVFCTCMLAHAQHLLINVVAVAPAHTLRCLVGDAAEGSTTRSYMGGEAMAGVAEEAATVVFCLDQWHPVVLFYLPVIQAYSSCNWCTRSKAACPLSSLKLV